MNNKSIFIILLACTIAVHANAQTNIETVLSSVEKNNKVLTAHIQYWEAQKLDYKTGLTLPNPTVQGQYLFGSPTTAGNQTDIFAVQSFDFPTSYKKRRELADVQGNLSTSSISTLRLDVLLEAKSVCLEMIYRNKLKTHFEGRQIVLEKLKSDFQTKLDNGDGNILDVNKTTLQLLEISQLQQENAIELKRLQTHLLELNGGKILAFSEDDYPLTPAISTFEEVEKAFEAADPIRQSLEQEKLIAEKQLELSQMWRLPKFEAGYHYQGILGQRFNGIHMGMTLPIWEQKNRTQTKQAQVIFSDLQLESYLNERYFEIQELYDRQLSLKKSMDEFQTALSKASNTALLDKALRLGEITTIEYFLEMSFYQNATIHYFKTEKEYQLAVAALYKYKL
ncbi:MAG: TolC family protein [Saprospiraceae bacterium]|nr:TolC family protein [Saprospiraceae bacterium]